MGMFVRLYVCLPPTCMHRYLATPFSFLNIVLDAIETLLGLRFFFKLFGADVSNSLIRTLYALTDPIVAPFAGIFRNLASEGLLIEWSTVIAMIVYGFIALLFARLILFLAFSVEDEDELEYHRHHHA